MKTKIVILLTVLFSSMLVAELPPKFSQISIFVNDRQALTTIWESGIDFEGSSGKIGGMMTFIAGESELRKLRNSNINFQIVHEDMAAYSKTQLASGPANALGFGYGSMGGFYTFNEVMAQLDSMKLLYPALITTRDSIGSTREGRAVWAVKLSDNAPTNEAGEQEVLYTSLHHAREPQGMMTLIYYMWWMLEHYGSDPQATYLLDNRQLWFIPVVNPDGYIYNQTTNPSGGGFWRKNRRDNGAGSFGVDPNRNYGTFEMWNMPNGGSSTDSTSETYRGTSPLSEPENQAIDNFMRTHTIKTCLNYHTYGNYLIYPYGYLPYESGDSLIFREWAYRMTETNHYTNGTDIQTVNYSTRGNADDFMYADTTKPRTYSMTPEVGTSGFWPPTFQIFPLAIENLGSNKFLATVAGHYPVIRRYEVQDSGSNGFIDRGESFSFVIDVKNIGLSTAQTLTIMASTNSPTIQLLTDTEILDSLPSQTTTQVTFTGYLESLAPTGIPFQLYIDYSDPSGFQKQDTINLYTGTPTTLLSDSASAGTGNWTTGLGWGLTSTAHTAPNAFTDSPSGNYSPNSSNALTSVSQFDLNGYDFAQLKFWTKWSIEPTWDFGTVEVSSDNGTSWATLRSQLSHAGSGRSGSQEPSSSWGYQSYSPENTWVEQEVDLTDYNNSEVKIRFRMAADNGDQRDGFYVDDIRLYGFISNFDTAATSQPTLSSPADGAANQSTTPLLTWNAAPNALFYRLQAALDSSFSIIVFDDSTIAAASKQIGPLPNGIAHYWRVLAKNSFGASIWSSPVWKFTTLYGFFSISVAERWNMISNPCRVPDSTVSGLFSSATSSAFGYEDGSGYGSNGIIEKGKGYWLKFPSAQSINIDGAPRLLDTIIVNLGWNLIGSIASPIAVNAIEQIPSDIVASGYFGFNGRYILTDSIQPGSGYWVKTTQAGSLVLSAASSIQPKRTSAMEETKKMNSLLFTDSRGQSAELFFQSSVLTDHQALLSHIPPVPPEHSFDVRYESNTTIISLAQSKPAIPQARIILQGHSYPVQINGTLTGNDRTFYEIIEESNGQASSSHVVSGGNPIIIDDPKVHSLLLRMASGTQLPKEFSLGQNYPNPFNPETRIQFDVPAPAKISLTIYNVLGQIITTLVHSQSYEAGHFDVPFRAANLPSGVYYYTLSAVPDKGTQSIHLSNKMLLTK